MRFRIGKFGSFIYSASSVSDIGLRHMGQAETQALIIFLCSQLLPFPPPPSVSLHFLLFFKHSTSIFFLFFFFLKVIHILCKSNNSQGKRIFSEKYFSLSPSQSYCLETTTAINLTLCLSEDIGLQECVQVSVILLPLFNPNRRKHICIFKNIYLKELSTTVDKILTYSAQYSIECIFHNSFNQPLLQTFSTAYKAAIYLLVHKSLKTSSNGSVLKF